MSNDPFDWAGIEDAYVNGDMSLERICAAFGLSPTTLRKYAKHWGWIRKVGTKPLRHGPRPRPPSVPRPKRPSVTEQRRRKTVERLLAALDRGLTELEARLAHEGEGGGGPRSAADAERDSRTLAGLTRLYAKLVELDERARGAAEAAGGKDVEDQTSTMKEATQDAERFRGELALRLQRLNQARNA